MNINLDKLKLDNPEQLEAHSVLQRIATGPELSKDISFVEAKSVTENILKGKIDPVRSALFFIALRMKRETDEENQGILAAIKEATASVICDVDEVIDLAEPYNGYNRTVPPSPFLPAVLAALGLTTVSHGVITCAPKFGVTHKQILNAAGIDTDLNHQMAAKKAAETGWAYVDQSQFCPELNALLDFRKLVVKRLAITTVETVIGPIRGKQKTHLLTGYVHKPYPPKYEKLAKYSGFDSCLLVRGIEGGTIPSLRQKAAIYYYHNQDELDLVEFDPAQLGFKYEHRAVNLPNSDWVTPDNNEDIAAIAVELGLSALAGKKGATYDALAYAAALVLWHTRNADSIKHGFALATKILDSGKALEIFKAR